MRYLLIIKSLKKLEIIGSFFNLTKVKYENIMLKNCFTCKIRNKTGISILTIVQNYTEERSRK